MQKIRLITSLKGGQHRVYRRTYEYDPASKNTLVRGDTYLGTMLGRDGDGHPVWINCRRIQAIGINAYMRDENRGLLGRLLTNHVGPAEAQTWSELLLAPKILLAAAPSQPVTEKAAFILPEVSRGQTVVNLNLTVSGKLAAARRGPTTEHPVPVAASVRLFHADAITADSVLLKRVAAGVFQHCIVVAEGRALSLPGFHGIKVGWFHGLRFLVNHPSLTAQAVGPLYWGSTVAQEFTTSWESKLGKSGISLTPARVDSWLMPGLTHLFNLNFQLLSLVTDPARKLLMMGPFLAELQVAVPPKGSLPEPALSFQEALARLQGSR